MEKVDAAGEAYIERDVFTYYEVTVLDSAYREVSHLKLGIVEVSEGCLILNTSYILHNILLLPYLLYSHFLPLTHL
jgi:hypothetical protein